MCARAESRAPAGAREPPELGEILRRHGECAVARHGANPTQRQVLRALGQCRTAALGGHLEACDRCGHQRAVYHSCRNRHCPKCQALAQADWLEARRADLLPVDYFHVVFTLPHELCPLALYRPRVIYDLLFRAASETLATFARDPRYFAADTGGTLGITAILHTWAQNLSLHPHLHCVVPGGALTAGGQRFVTPRHKGFLFPVRALSQVFRAKFLEGLRKAFEAGKLEPDTSVPMLCNALRSIDWVVYAKPPFTGSESVLAYLGAYTHRIAISNHRILRLDEGHVTFRYRDSADGRKQKLMRLTVDEFIRRFLLHVLPKGFVRIRHYGLLANRSRTKKIAQCRALLSVPAQQAPVPEAACERLLRLTGVDIHRCPECHEGRMLVVAEIDRPRRHSHPPVSSRSTTPHDVRPFQSPRRASISGPRCAPARNPCARSRRRALPTTPDPGADTPSNHAAPRHPSASSKALPAIARPPASIESPRAKPTSQRLRSTSPMGSPADPHPARSRPRPRPGCP